jgi:hypothetical protein
MVSAVSTSYLDKFQTIFTHFLFQNADKAALCQLEEGKKKNTTNTFQIMADWCFFGTLYGL